MDVRQKKTVEIHRGLFLARYEAADDSIAPPRVAISMSAHDAENIEVFLPPGAEEPVLWSPGACLVIRAAQSGKIELTVTPAKANGSVSAKIQFVPISTDPSDAAEVGISAGDIDLSQMKIRGHVAGIGDVVVRPGEWIGGPAAPSRIEGLQLHWPNKPASIDLHYAVSIGGPRPTKTPLATAGTFAGSRGRALPLVGAVLELAGSKATQYRLEVEALFPGSPVLRMSGHRVELSGPSGREPLVGLRFWIESQQAAQDEVPHHERPQQKSRQPSKKEPAPLARMDEPEAKAKGTSVPKRSNKVRVFRGGRV